MNWFRSHPRSAWLIALTLVFPVLLLLYAMGSILAARAEVQSGIERLEPRVARMKGLGEAEQQMSAALAGGAAQEGMVYPAAQDQAAVAAALQAEVRRLLGDAGMEVTNSQVLNTEKLENFDRIAISVMATGDLASLDAALRDFSVYRPILLVESLDVYPNRTRRGDAGPSQTLTARIQIMSLRSAT